MINLTETSPRQLRAPDAAVSPRANDGGELDCQWVVLAPPGKVVRLDFTQVDMMDSNCNEDFIEVRETFKETSVLFAYHFSARWSLLTGSRWSWRECKFDRPLLWVCAATFTNRLDQRHVAPTGDGHFGTTGQLRCHALLSRK